MTKERKAPRSPASSLPLSPDTPTLPPLPPAPLSPSPHLLSPPLPALYPPPRLLRRELVVQAQEIKQITRTPPGIAIPMRVTAPEDLRAGTQMTTSILAL